MESPRTASPPRLAHQVPDAQQDGAGADMAAQAAAVGVEPRPGRYHLHRSGARTSLRERRPLRPGLRWPGRLLLPLSSAAPTPTLGSAQPREVGVVTALGQ